jgi:hypothetical protein
VRVLWSRSAAADAVAAPFSPPCSAYRGFYILNWIYRFATEKHYRQWIVWISGVAQTALYAGEHACTHRCSTCFSGTVGYVAVLVDLPLTIQRPALILLTFFSLAAFPALHLRFLLLLRFVLEGKPAAAAASIDGLHECGW